MSEAAGAPTSDPLNRIGLLILDFGSDPRYIALSTLAIVALFSCIHKLRRGVWPDTAEWLRGGLALIAAASGLMAASIFLLTRPPAYDRLSPEMRPILGLILLVVSIGFALKELRSTFLVASHHSKEQSVKISPSVQSKQPLR